MKTIWVVAFGAALMFLFEGRSLWVFEMIVLSQERIILMMMLYLLMLSRLRILLRWFQDREDTAFVNPPSHSAPLS